ncbi:hypothetical protein HAX54_006280 [Datura stramonium]|uniref:Uncharacterized protein n=1 Tax=Datura stramonium TaxID=4076 RepID=A0ABS8TCF6_DATST|nr:hypothetical protein [Datura stramonium]
MVEYGTEGFLEHKERGKLSQKVVPAKERRNVMLENTVPVTEGEIVTGKIAGIRWRDLRSLKGSENALLELAKDEYSKILIMEEGLLLVPLVGAAAYKSPSDQLIIHSPSLPDGTKIEQNPKPSRYETEEENKSGGELPSNPRFTLLPCMDGVARLVLILGLEDESAIARAADAIADVSIKY